MERYAGYAVGEEDLSWGACGLRWDRVLIAQALAYMRNEELVGEGVRHVLIGRGKHMGGSHSEFNYAYGGEPLEGMYGHRR